MQDINNLEQYFLNEIKRQSDLEVEKLKEEQTAIRDEAIEEIQLEAKKEASAILDQDLKDLSSEYTVKISKVKEEKNRKLMIKREELTTQIFDAVRDRLRSFTASEKYVNYMKEQVNKLKVSNASVTFYIGRNDVDKADTIFAACPKASVKVDSHIQIGGFRMEHEAAGIVVDETFDARLEDEKTWFYANSSLAIR